MRHLILAHFSELPTPLTHTCHCRKSKGQPAEEREKRKRDHSSSAGRMRGRAYVLLCSWYNSEKEEKENGTKPALLHLYVVRVELSRSFQYPLNSSRGGTGSSLARLIGHLPPEKATSFFIPGAKMLRCYLILQRESSQNWGSKGREEGGGGKESLVAPGSGAASREHRGGKGEKGKKWET